MIGQLNKIYYAEFDGHIVSKSKERYRLLFRKL